MILALLIIGGMAIIAVLASVYIEDRYQSKIQRARDANKIGVERAAPSGIALHTSTHRSA